MRIERGNSFKKPAKRSLVLEYWNIENRCDGKVHCSDASDEKAAFCDPAATNGFFVCCTANTKIPESKVCDNFDDCPRDRSDQFLDTCSDKTGGKLKCLMPGNSVDDLTVITITPEQLNDGKEDCMFDADENCGWKRKAADWIHPLKQDGVKEYFDFLDLLEKNPAASRWYTMATRDEIETLGHKMLEI